MLAQLIALIALVAFLSYLYLDWRQTRLRIFPRGIHELNPVIRWAFMQGGLHGVTVYFATWAAMSLIVYAALCFWFDMPLLAGLVGTVATLIERAVVVRNTRMGIRP